MSSLPSPSRRNLATLLPPELLLRIFHQCKPPLQDDTLPWHAYPWPYSHVCRSWLDILISSPMEWTEVQLRTPPSLRRDVEREHQELERCVLQLKRTQGKALTIHISTYSRHPALQNLLHERHRWKDASIRISPIEVSPFLDALEGCRSLETMRFGPSRCAGSFRLESNRRVTVDTLRFLRMAAGSDPSDHLLCALRLPALEELYVLDPINIDTLLDFLYTSLSDKSEVLLLPKPSSTATKLTTLSLTGLVLTDDDVPRMRATLELCSPSLRRLEIRFCAGKPGFHGILSLLTWDASSPMARAQGNKLCPRLTDLTLIEAGMVESMRWMLMEMLASRCGPAAPQTRSAYKIHEPTAELRSNVNSGRWPDCFLQNARIELVNRVSAGHLFDEEESGRIKELTRSMDKFSLEACGDMIYHLS